MCEIYLQKMKLVVALFLFIGYLFIFLYIKRFFKHSSILNSNTLWWHWNFFTLSPRIRTSIEPKQRNFLYSYSLTCDISLLCDSWIIYGNMAQLWTETITCSRVHVHQIREGIVSVACMGFSCFDPKIPKVFPIHKKKVTTPLFILNVTYHLNTNIAHKILYD